MQISARAYRPRRPETTALYEVVRENLETLYGAIDEGAIAVRIPKHARKELEAYLGCGLLCRGLKRSVRRTKLRAAGCRRRRSRGVENAGRATGRQSLLIKSDRGHQASFRKGSASHSRARRGW